MARYTKLTIEDIKHLLSPCDTKKSSLVIGSLGRIRLDTRRHPNSSSAVCYSKLSHKYKEGETKVKCPHSSTMRPGLVPTTEIVTDPDDLEYVNRKISASGVRDATARAVECGEGSFLSSSTSSDSRQSSNAFESSAPTTTSASIYGKRRASEPTTPSTAIKGILKKRTKQLDISSSDSKARCTSEDSPLQGIEHNVCRYFDSGGNTFINKELFISQFCNYTVPAPNTDEAWVQMNKSRESQDDRNQVWQYQKHHMWSPTISEPSSPLALPPKHAFPLRNGGAANNDPPPIQVSSSTHDEPTRPRPLCSADFEGSDDEDDISITNIWEDAGGVRPAEDILQCPEAEMRKIQLLLQAKILREIAELVHESGADYRPWGDAVAGWADEGDD